MKKKYLIIALVVIIALVIATISLVACTQEAKQCPDGSYVGRTGPKCEFKACPATSSAPAGWQTYTNVKHGYSIKYPAGSIIESIPDSSSDSLACIKIKEGIGYIKINTGAADPCGGPTGIGSGDIRIDDTVIIGNKKISSVGFLSASKDFSFLSFEFNNKIYVTYGVDNRNQSFDDQNYTAVINSLKEILSTFKTF